MPDLLTTAHAYLDAGLAPLPLRTDGSKAPAVAWRAHIDQAPTRDIVDAWFNRDTDGIGTICGTPAGNLEMLEVEGRAVHLTAQLAELMADNGLGDLWAQIDGGWLEVSPSGGLHWHYRVTDGPARPNTKLARRPATADELAHNPADKVKVLIETRGQGGFTVLAPSAGRSHPTGKPWIRAKGGPDTIPTITADERDALHAIASMLDEMPTELDGPDEPQGRRHDVSSDGVRPGDDFNHRATWADVLGKHGWARTRHFGGTCYGWRRPGKTDPGISATTGRNDADNLYVFSSSTEFETEKAYSKFAAYTLLEHGGDYAAAAKALRAEGYGAEASRPVDDLRDLVAPTASSSTAGSAALAPTQLPERTDATPRLALVEERTLTYSDDANALALVDTFGDRIRYCDDRGRWLAWDGNRWHWCGRSGGVVREYAKRVARNLPETNDKAITHKKRSLGAVGTTAMLTQAATDDRIAVNLSDLDAHPWELNTPAGIVDLRSGQLSPPDPAKLHTRVTDVAPDFDADDTFWQRFLEQTFNGTSPSGAELIAYVQRLVGHSAVGVVGPHVLPFAQGSGGNGKGVFLETCVRVLGDYATTAPSGFLMAKVHPGHETELARLAGARMVLCSEVNEDDRFDEAKVKQLTGGDTITARFMQQDHFTFTPSHHLWLMGNHQPAVRAGGRSFWRRLRLIPFLHEVPEDQVIDDLQGILAREHGPAVLAWIIRGAVDYAARGLREPDQVKAATDTYAHDQDTVTRFLEEQCIVGGGEHVQLKVAVLRAAYEAWCADEGEHAVTAKAFGMQLQRHGIESAKGSKGVRIYRGVTLRSDDETSEAPQEWYR